MKLTFLKSAPLLIVTLILLAACEEKLSTEFGNSKIYFSNANTIITYKGIDSVQLSNIMVESDTVLNIVGVYRSGIVENLEEITISLAIDSVYIDSIIAKAQTALPIEMTDIMTNLKNSQVLGGSYFSIPETVTIPQGERIVAVPVTIKRSLIKLYKNNIFNYNAADLASTTVPKDKKLILPMTLTSTSKYSILETKSRCYLQILKLGNMK